jgi:hypothetical protein
VRYAEDALIEGLTSSTSDLASQQKSASRRGAHSKMRRQQRTPRPKTRLFQSLPFQGLIAAVPWNLVFTAIIGAVVMWMLLVSSRL